MNSKLRDFFETVSLPEMFPNPVKISRDIWTGEYKDPQVQKLWIIFQDGAEAAAYDVIEMLEGTTDPGYLAANQVAELFDLPHDRLEA